MGVVLFQMFSTEYPFQDEAEIANAAPVNFKSNDAVWSVVSPEAKNVIKKTLEKDPLKRYSVDDIEMDNWLANDSVVRTIVQDLIENGQSNNADKENIPCNAAANTTSSSNATASASSTISAISSIDTVKLVPHEPQRGLQCFRCDASFADEDVMFAHFRDVHNLRFIRN